MAAARAIIRERAEFIYRLTDQGRDFARRACPVWRQRPLWQRLATRFAG